MSLKEGNVCDPSTDKEAIGLVAFFGSLEAYDKVHCANEIAQEIAVTQIFFIVTGFPEGVCLCMGRKFCQPRGT